jgi:6-pyruvoyl-tetrahydropterin synthase
MPLAQLDAFVRATVLHDFSTRNLNVEVPEFLTLVPTTENVASVIARRLALAWPRSFPGAGARFEKVRIWETKNNIFEEFAPSAASESASHPQAALASVGPAGRKVNTQ